MWILLVTAAFIGFIAAILADPSELHYTHQEEGVPQEELDECMS